MLVVEARVDGKCFARCDITEISLMCCLQIIRKVGYTAASILVIAEEC